MNITPHVPTLSLPTVANPPTESLRRENHQREVISQVAATNQSAAEKGVASDKERARTPAQTNEQVDFANLRKQAEQEASAINGEREHGNSEHNEHADHQGEFNRHEKEAEKQQQAEEQQAIADEKIISELKQRDQEVKTHERAHATIGGTATGSPSYTYEVGPDGKKYAVSGEVSVDLSVVPGDPKATIAKMQKIHAAALAPINPSVQDTRVAASAAQKILDAQSELLSQNNELALDKAESPVSNNSHFREEQGVNQASLEFDQLINQTIAAQEQIAPEQTKPNTAIEVNSAEQIIPQQSLEVQQRANRIESFYQDISQAYEKPANYQFELTA